MSSTLAVRSARIRNDEIVDILVRDGLYAKIEPQIKERGETEIDAAGRFVCETFVVGQLHLDKVFTGDWLDASAKTNYFDNDMGGAMTAIELAAAVKEQYTVGNIKERVDAAMELALASGTSHIRAFIDVDPIAGTMGIEAAVAVRDKWKGLVDLDVIAFPQDGVVREPGTEKLLNEAMEMGADLVGGIPWIEFTEADMKAHVDIIFGLAKKYDCDISMLVDDAGDPGLRTTEYLAVQTETHGWHGRVSACHARAMSLYNEVYHRKVVALIKRAGMGIVTNPHTGPLHVRVADLDRENVTVALGGESINDAYYPYGRCNMLESAFAASHTLWMMAPQHWQLLLDMITANPAKILRLDNHAISVGAPANFIVSQEKSLRETIATHREPRYVIRDGRVVAESEFKTSRVARFADA